MVDILLLAYAVLTYPTGVLAFYTVMKDTPGKKAWFDWPLLLTWPVSIPVGCAYFFAQRVIERVRHG